VQSLQGQLERSRIAAAEHAATLTANATELDALQRRLDTAAAAARTAETALAAAHTQCAAAEERSAAAVAAAAAADQRAEAATSSERSVHAELQQLEALLLDTSDRMALQARSGRGVGSPHGSSSSSVRGSARRAQVLPPAHRLFSSSPALRRGRHANSGSNDCYQQQQYATPRKSATLSPHAGNSRLLGSMTRLTPVSRRAAVRDSSSSSSRYQQQQQRGHSVGASVMSSGRRSVHRRALEESRLRSASPRSTASQHTAVAEAVLNALAHVEDLQVSYTTVL
jgi:hypothetical protein